MKRKVLCVFSLILFLLIFCTFLSMKIEVEMLTQVEVKTINGSKIYFGNIELPISVLFKDEYQSHLYEVVEGTGWESGMRIQEIASQQYQVSEESQLVTLSPGQDYSFALTASRQPSYGELVEIVEDTQTAPDTYLVYYPTGVPEYEGIPESYELLSQSENALLLEVEKGTFPYFEHRAKNELREIATPDMRVFSLTAVEDFLSQLPLLTAVALLLILPVMLWAASCVFSGWEKGKGVVWLNIALIVLTLCVLPQVLEQIDLPASLLPSDNILDVSYYRTTFGVIFDIFEELEMVSSMKMKEAAISQVVGVWRISGGVTGVLIFAETIFLYMKSHKHMKKKKYVVKYLSAN